MNKSSSSVFDFELISIMLIFSISLGLVASFGLIEGASATLLFWILSQGRIFTRFGDLRRSKDSAWRYLLFNEFLLATLAIIFGITLTQ